ncbi:MAG TPA: lasso peptide biosynthesis B2 protein [Candidatus Acidoferrum sp.]|nr:lasso peptide biosynthesis B2 protein [Candidatus Acidoferrum sp.]
MWEPLQRYRALDRASRRIFWRAAILLPLVRGSLRSRGYGKTFSSLQRRAQSQIKTTGNPIESREDVQRTCRMVCAALRYSPVQYTCLEESLTLWYLLRGQGIPACLRIGVRKENGKFEAHAWVEYGGEALNQDEAFHSHYAAFEEDLPKPPQEQP